MRVITFFAICMALFMMDITSIAAVPSMINYQGKLTKADGTLFSETPTPYSLTFAIYSQPTGGLPLWSEINTNVQVKKGLFSVLLGSVNNLPANIFDGTDRYFGVTVGTDAEMSPRQQIASVPFAFRAASAGTVDDGSITKAKLAPDVTTTTMDAIATGWIPAGEIWTYSSSGIIQSGTNPANTKYSVGDKVKFTQDGITKYGYIHVSSGADAGIYFTGGSDYTLTNSPITNPYYSKVSSPLGFPQWFNWIPTFGTNNGASYINTTIILAKFRINGKTLFYNTYVMGTIINGFPNYLNFTVPVARNNSIKFLSAGYGQEYDNDPSLFGNIAKVRFENVTSIVIHVLKNDSSNFSSSSNTGFNVAGSYEI